MKRYLRVVLYGTLLLAVLAVGIGLALTHLRGAKLYSIQSGSMVPAIHKGDLVSVTRVPVSQLAVGDVITFRNPSNKNQTVTHRIVQPATSRTDGRIVTKGDANQGADPALSPAMIIGRVDYTVPKAGLALDFVRKPLGLLTIIYVPSLIIIVREVRMLMNHFKKMQPYRLRGRGLPLRHGTMPPY